MNGTAYKPIGNLANDLPLVQLANPPFFRLVSQALALAPPARPLLAP